jgi:excisionase family DNA binding protein
VPEVLEASETMTTSEVAEMLGLSDRAVRAIADRGALPAARLTPTSPRRFRREDVDRLIRAALHGEAALPEAARQDDQEPAA